MKATKKKSKRTASGAVKKIAPYVVGFIVLLGIMVFGSQKSLQSSSASVIQNVISDNSFVVTADQLSESYIVAEVASSFSLPTGGIMNENFASVAIRYATTGAIETGTIEKPNIIDTSDLSRGIITYTVVEGNTLASIAARFGVTTTNIRWSNNMKNDTISVGQRLYIPSVPGILYTVKSNDTIAGIAEKYKSNVEQIILYNDLETSGIIAGQTIILPGGELPNTERPEYVAPTPRPSYSSNLTDSGNRYDMFEIGSRSYWRSLYTNDGNPSARGQCTWFSWYWRRYNMPENYWLPTGAIGNARDWAARLSGSYVVNNYPAYGAVVQTSTARYGHVGVVIGVVEGQYITIQEMNYNYNSFRVFQSKVSWADALRFRYIHARR